MAKSKLTEDIAIIGGQHFFVKGMLEIPVLGEPEPFAWLVWVSLSEANFTHMMKNWTKEGREAHDEPYFGWLNTELSDVYGESTLDMKTHVHIRKVGQRPFIELEPTNHPLAIEQQAGIPSGRLGEIAEVMLHGPQARRGKPA